MASASSEHENTASVPPGYDIRSIASTTTTTTTHSSSSAAQISTSEAFTSRFEPMSLTSSPVTVSPTTTSKFSIPSLPAPKQSSITDSFVPFRARRGFHHHTWARTFHSFPELYITPQDVREVQRAVILARQCRRHLMCIGGSAHSPSDLTMTSSWMINLDHLSNVLHVERDASTGRGIVHFEAGISLKNLNLALAEHGLTIANLGSINPQSIAGAISTATHGSSLRHGLISQNVRGMRVVLADGSAVWCSPDEREDLFRAALVSLGAVGIVTEIELEVVPDSNIEWHQSLVPLDELLSSWGGSLWTAHEFVRCWWMPYSRRMIVWHADRTSKPVAPPSSQSWYGGVFGFHFYRMLLLAGHYFPPILPLVERFVFGLQYRFSPGEISSGVEIQRNGLLMDCLYSQWVNEWAVPLQHGPEIITRLSRWIHGEEGHGIPFSSRGVYVHCPIEVRVTQGAADKNPRPRGYLDPSCADGPTLYLNATLYRPFGKDPPCRERYFQAFEWLVKQYGGRPHWAKNFATVTKDELRRTYGDNLKQWLRVRNESDPDGLFVGAWHRKYLLDDEDTPTFELEEAEVQRKVGNDGGFQWSGTQATSNATAVEEKKELQRSTIGLLKTASSDESFEIIRLE